MPSILCSAHEHPPNAATHEPHDSYDLPDLRLTRADVRPVAGRPVHRRGLRRARRRTARAARHPARARPLRHDARRGGLRADPDQAHRAGLDPLPLVLVPQRHQPHDDGEPARDRAGGPGAGRAVAGRPRGGHRLQRRHAARRLHGPEHLAPGLRPLGRLPLRRREGLRRGERLLLRRAVHRAPRRPQGEGRHLDRDVLRPRAPARLRGRRGRGARAARGLGDGAALPAD